MDPVTAFGAAAGALQIFDFSIKALLGSVRFLQALRDSPKQIAELLQDADKSIIRLLDLNQRLQQANDPLVQKLSSGRVQDLRAVASDGYEATRHLHDALQRLQTSRSDSWMKKTWKAMKISTHASEDIERTLARIQRAHAELQRALQLAGLDIDADQSEQLTRLLASVEDTKIGVESANSNIQSLVTTSKVHETAISSSLNQLRLDHEVATTRLFEVQSATQTSVVQQSATITNHLASLGDNERETQVQLSGLHDDMSSKHDRILDEIHSMRDEFLRVMLQGGGRISTQSESTAQRLTAHQTKELNTEICEALVTRPQAQREACDKWLPHTQGISTSSEGLLNLNACGCGRRKPKRWSRYKGIFGLQYEALGIHKPDCPLSAVDGGSWRYSLSMQLLPFLRKTIELTCGVSFSGGGFELSSPLRVWHTVRRSKSPVFRLFDAFPTFCNEQGSEPKILAEYNSSLSGRFVQLSCSAQSVDEYLSHIIETIMSLASQRQISPWRVRDEFGSTLLHEAINVSAIFFHGSAHLKNLIPLLELATKGGVLSNCEAADGFRDFNAYSEPDPVNGIEHNNVLDYTAELLFSAEYRVANMPLTQSLSGLGFEESTPMSTRLTSMDFHGAKVRHDKISLVQANKSLAGLLGDDMKEAIIYRDLARVRKQLQLTAHKSWICCSRPSYAYKLRNSYLYDDPFSPLCDLELALGWRDGLLLLLQAGANPLHATEVAVLRNDTDSFRLLLLSPNFSFCPTQDGIDTCTVVAVSETDNQDIRDQMIDKMLKMPSCPPPLVAEIYDALVGEQSNGNLHLKLSFMDRLYACGFKGIDAKYNQVVGAPAKCTPLHKLAMRMLADYYILSTNDDIYYGSWFLKRGANPIFHSKFGPRNLVAEALARNFALMHFRFAQTSLNVLLRDWRRTIELVLRRCKLTDGDSCSCPCSSRGCLPLHQLIRCLCSKDNEWRLPASDCRCNELQQPDLDNLLEDWLTLCNANKEQKAISYREAVRSEVFDRLQMTHTCCVMGSLTFRITRASESVSEEIIAEENELALQLDLIMEAFLQFSRKRCRPNEKPLRGWWALLDFILPEPKPYQRCYKYDGGPRHVLHLGKRLLNPVDPPNQVVSSAEDSDRGSLTEWSESSDESLDIRGGIENSREESQCGSNPTVGTEEAVDQDGMDETDSDVWEDVNSSEEDDDCDRPELASAAGIDEYSGLDFFDVILRHFSKVLGKGWADDFLRREGLAV